MEKLRSYIQHFSIFPSLSKSSTKNYFVQTVSTVCFRLFGYLCEQLGINDFLAGGRASTAPHKAVGRHTAQQISEQFVEKEAPEVSETDWNNETFMILFEADFIDC